MHDVFEKVTAWSVLSLAVGVGGLSMMAFAAFLYAGPLVQIDLGLGLWSSMAINAVLSLIFFVQHSVMVRAWFKNLLVRLVPAHFVGAVYAIASGIALLSVVLLWQESERVIASATGTFWWIARGLFVLAAGGIVWGALALGGFDSLGLRPIRNRFRTCPARPPVLTVRGPYRWVRHPLYFFVLVMMWSFPFLTLDRLLFNLLWTAWIITGTVLEERDLIAEFGDRYRVYQSNVPMLIPNRIAGWS